MLIKFKSVKLTNDCYPTIWDDDIETKITKITNFNKYFKGKYVWLLNNTFIVPFEEDMKKEDETKGLTLQEFKLRSLLPQDETETPLLNDSKIFFELTDFLDEDIYNPLFIDVVNTEKCQSIGRWIGFNSFEPDEDITIEELKLFRTWLASQLYNIYEEKTDVTNPELHQKILYMLKYYKNGMKDAATELMNEFNNTAYQMIPSASTCSCNQNFDISVQNAIECDVLWTYRENIHKFMVSIFTDIKFWMSTNDDYTFISEIIKYLNGIIKHDFPFNSIERSFGYGDCSCLTTQTSMQESSMEILKQLKQSFEYMSEEKQVYHKNFIYSVLLKWSDVLYEQMLWV